MKFFYDKQIGKLAGLESFHIKFATKFYEYGVTQKEEDAKKIVDMGNFICQIIEEEHILKNRKD